MEPWSIMGCYTFIFASLGSYNPYLPVFFAAEASGLTTQHIGMLIAVKPAMGFIGQPLWGMLVDVTRKHVLILRCSAVVAAFAPWSIYAAVKGLSGFGSVPLLFWALLIAIVFGSFFGAPVVSLIDVATLQYLDDPRTYGQYRLWGAIGFGTATGLSGLLATMMGNVYGICFFVACLCGCAALPLIWKFTFNKIIETDSDDDTLPPVTLGRILALCSRPNVVAFLLTVTIGGMSMGLIDTFLFVYIKELGGSPLIMGLSRAITCFAEVPFFHYADRLMTKYGTFGVLCICQLAYVVRQVYYANMTNPWLVLPCEVLHGLTFAAMWATSSHYAHHISPPEMDASIQGITRGANMGLGFGLGAVIGGYSYEAIGPVRTFTAGAWLAVIGFTVALVTKIFLGDDNKPDEEYSPVAQKILVVDEINPSYSAVTRTLSNEDWEHHEDPENAR